MACVPHHSGWRLPEMTRCFSNRLVRFVLWVTLFSITAALLVCWRMRIWSLEDFRDYQEVSRYEIGSDWWFSRIARGDSFEGLIDKHPPHRVREIGRFSVLSYYVDNSIPGALHFESLRVLVKEGKVVGA